MQLHLSMEIDILYMGPMCGYTRMCMLLFILTMTFELQRYYTEWVQGLSVDLACFSVMVGIAQDLSLCFILSPIFLEVSVHNK